MVDIISDMIEKDYRSDKSVKSNSHCEPDYHSLYSILEKCLPEYDPRREHNPAKKC